MKPQEAIQVHDLFSVAGKIALVTGGSRGIGLMIARGLVEAGAKVYISSRHKDASDEVAQQLGAVGECVSLPADVSTATGCAALAREVLSARRPVTRPGQQCGRGLGRDIDEIPGVRMGQGDEHKCKVYFLSHSRTTRPAPENRDCRRSRAGHQYWLYRWNQASVL